MKLQSIEYHGSEQSRRTGWMRWAGFTLARMDDGSTRYFTEGTGESAVLSELDARGIDTSEFRIPRIIGYPPKPESATHYQHNYGYQVPEWLGAWEWSTTFGRWGRIVRFADGWEGYTWPRIETEAGKAGAR